MGPEPALSAQNPPLESTGGFEDCVSSGVQGPWLGSLWASPLPPPEAELFVTQIADIFFVHSDMIWKYRVNYPNPGNNSHMLKLTA